jgi:hypothetical protein
LSSSAATVLPADSLPRQSFAWGVVVSLALLDLAWIHAGGWSVPRDPLVRRSLCVLIFVPLLFERYRSDLRLRSTILVTGFLIAFSYLASILSYLVLSVGAPLADAALARWDAALGFDWVSAAYWVGAHPGLQRIFQLAYYSGLPQMGLVVVYLGFTLRLAQLHEFAQLFMAGSMLAIATSLLFPAAGPWFAAPPGIPFDASSLSNFFPLHSGTVRILDLNTIQGLISMPSEHAMIGIFLAYAMRGTGPLFLLAIVLNTLLVLATPTEGGHYLVDVIAGVLCAAALIAWSRRTTRAVSLSDARR